jgi:hypothetical protein
VKCCKMTQEGAGTLFFEQGTIMELEGTALLK